VGILEDKLAALDKKRNEKEYARALARREANVAKNAIEGKSFSMQGVPMEQSIHRADSLDGVREKMKDIGNSVDNLSGKGAVAKGTAHTPGLLSLSSKFPKLKAILGLAGPAVAAASAMGMGSKAMAGDIPGAIGDGVTLAKQFLPPGVEEAIETPDLGAGSDIVPPKEEQFDFSQYKTKQTPEIAISPVQNKPSPTRYEDFKKEVGGEALRKRLGLK
jgi:hypothetical protein